ncbi:MAG: multidrug effflux MFS transporter [Aliarcobacter sp.]|nr:multidrug effflux MFS transporter [Aliarcobacter sp.]
MKKTSNHLYLAILLASLTSVGPMGIDTYIPSIPDIAKSFYTSIEKVELSLSIFLIGLSFGQIFGGPISDNYGRKKSSIIGLLGFSFFSFLIIFSQSIYEVWIYRFFEAFFGGIVLINTSAVVRDKFKGNEAAKMFSIIGTARSIAPLIAPAIGAFIIHFFSWKVVFVFLTIYPLILVFLVSKKLEESFTFVKQDVFNSFKEVITHKIAMKPMITLGISFSGFFILITKSSFIFIEYFKISTDYFPLYFSFSFIILILMTRINISLLKKFRIIFLIKFAIVVQILISVLMVLNYKDITLIQTLIYMAIYMSMMAFIFGNTLAITMEYFPKNAGVASSVSGVLQFGLAAIITSIVINFHDETLLSIFLSTAILSLISYFIIIKYKEEN